MCARAQCSYCPRDPVNHLGSKLCAGWVGVGVCACMNNKKPHLLHGVCVYVRARVCVYVCSPLSGWVVATYIDINK